MWILESEQESKFSQMSIFSRCAMCILHIFNVYMIIPPLSLFLFLWYPCFSKHLVITAVIVWAPYSLELPSSQSPYLPNPSLTPTGPKYARIPEYFPITSSLSAFSLLLAYDVKDGI